ncbi:glycosyltransferase 87 family protein [Gordonia sp. DT219]|uniref:glycosyltransferase 87 family protein n=1 Tax=Gordonia sp. DT219 TaxID=3416658 RepID=UPI003CEB9B86
MLRSATAEREPRSAGWGLIGIAAIAAIAVFVWQLTVIPAGNPFYGLFHNTVDLRVYLAGGRTVLRGDPLYNHAMLADLDFTYPPFAAVIFAPLALASLATAKILWWGAIGLALVATVLLGFRSLGYRVDARLWVLSVLVAVASTALEPVRTTIWLGQVNIFLMLLILADLVFLDLRRPRSRLRGLWVGVAAGIKLTPGFFVVYLLVIRRWRAAVLAVVGFAVTVAIGFLVIPGDSRDYWTTYLGSADRVGRVDSPANQSVNGLISQLLAYFGATRYRHPYPDGGTVFQAPGWMWVPVAVVVVVLGLWAAVVAYRRGWRLLSVTITGMTGAAASPFSWGHHWVWFVPLLVVAIDVAYRGALTDRRRVWWWLVPAALVVATFSWSYNWWTSGRYQTSDHAIAIGVFMMPRWADTHWYDAAAVVFYSCAYLAVLLVTIIITLVAGRPRRSVADVTDGQSDAAGDPEVTSASSGPGETTPVGAQLPGQSTAGNAGDSPSL